MFLHLLLQLWWLTLAWASLETKPGCQPKCGDINIPYPFGFGDAACSLSSNHNIRCDTSSNPPRPFLNPPGGNFEILEISLTRLRIKNDISYNCDESGAVSNYNASMDLTGSPYKFSDTENKFTAIGCNTLATIQGFQEGNVPLYTGGCLSVCDKKENVINGSCSGIGCCQTSIPSRMTYFFATPDKYISYAGMIYRCSYAFLVEQDRYIFKESDLLDPSFVNKPKDVPVVIDWVVRNETCEEAQRNWSTYACQENSICDYSYNGAGCRCNCSKGYSGNPYLSHGCQDIDECADKNNNDCMIICSNTPGGYNCSCPIGTYGDGTRRGSGCIGSPDKKKLQVIMITLGIGLTVGLFLLLASLWLYQVLKKRRNKKIKEYFFKLNGGLLLKQQISSAEGSVEKTNIFNAEELEKATDYYNENRILGQGGQGTVYKGMLTDGKIVAIKKPRTIDEGQVEQFINEVVILSQINHRNVVKLLGCCLETKVPLLVYEYISNGTLFHHVHNQSEEFSMTWDNRLRIATEIAGALAYLHSAASMPIYHRDVKSTNILLDDKYRAKVSDFGISRSIPVDKTHLTTLVQGTFGYLDPEYFQSSQFTDKSDVYSFGVVLVELLTGEKPIISLIGSQERRNLVTHFIQSTEENRLFEILDVQLMEAQKEEIEAVAILAKRCLNLNGKKRPPMKEVAMELEGLRMSSVLLTTKMNHNEAEVITDLSRLWETDSTSTGYGNLENSVALRLDTQPLLLNTSSYSV